MSRALTAVDELIAGAALVVLVGSLACASSVLVRRLRLADRALQWLVGMVLFVGLGVSVPLVLAAASVLTLGSTLALSVVVLALVVRYDGARPVARPDDTPRGGSGWSSLVAVAVTTAVVLLCAAETLDPGRSMDFDTVDYHLPNLAHWVTSGSLWGLSSAGPLSAHPSNAEMFTTLLALPSGGDELVYLMPLVFMVIATLAGAVLARTIVSDRPGLGALAVLGVITTPVMLRTQVDSLATDLASASLLLAALALARAAMRRPADARALLAVAGVALGLGVGSKYSAYVPGALVLAGAFVWNRRQALAMVPGAMLLPLPWMVRNLLETGNPLYPQPLGPLAGWKSPIEVVNNTVLDHVRAGNRAPLDTIVEAFVTGFGPVLLLAVVGIVVAPFLHPSVRRTHLLVGIAACAFGAYLVTPYTGGGPRGLAAVITSNTRYAVFFVLLSAVIAAAVLPSKVAVAGLLVVAASNGWELLAGDADRVPDLAFDAPALAIGAVALVVTFVALRTSVRPARPGARVVVGLAVVLLGASVLAGGAAYHREDRGNALSPLERQLAALGFRRPVLAVGVTDKRSLLGPRLDREIVLVVRGGRGKDQPFVSFDQFRRELLGVTTAPLPPGLGARLDRELLESGLDLLVVGRSKLSAPTGWAPGPEWCRVAALPGGIVYTLAGSPGATCATP